MHLGVIVGFVPAMLFALMIASAVWGDVPRWFGVYAGLSGVGAYFLSSAYLRGFRCPNCGERFNEALVGSPRKCCHCHCVRGAPSRAQI